MMIADFIILMKIIKFKFKIIFYECMVVKIFISYSQDDFFARGVKIKNYLSKLISNAEVFIDQSKSKGQDWQKKNDEKLVESDIVIVILTPASLLSHEIAREVDIAKKKDKIILPCKDDNLDLPWKDIPWELSSKDGIIFDEDEVLKTRLYREVTRIMEDSFGRNIRKVAVYTSIETKAKLKHGDIPLIHNKQVFNLSYFVNSGTVSDTSAKVDEDANSILATITCDEQTEIGISLPRKLIDATTDLKDDDFFVLINGEEVRFQEESDEKERTLTMLISKGINEIEIIGTQLLGISIGVTTISKNTIRTLPGSGIPHDGKYLEPKVLRIKQGDTVTWLNGDNAAHTFTSGDPTMPDTVQVLFDSGLAKPGSIYNITFNNKGIFNYFCIVHPWKIGKIIVE